VTTNSDANLDELPQGVEHVDRLVGTTVDRYEVVRFLGAGAFGVVYEVRHRKLGKRFAMKVIHEELACIPKFVARFEQEARACSFLEHPNCISVTDFGRHGDNVLYLIMEFVEGESLLDILERGPLDLGEALEITRQILLGLEHAHGAKIIHRDMKLENVMLVRSGDQRVVKILDFGIARVPVEGDSKITQAGVIFGTPRYMAPEQAMTTQVDERADLYAVGVMLWMMLLTESPIDAEGQVELLQKKLSEPAPALNERAPGKFPLALCALLDRALEREPSKRSASAREMRHDVEAVMGELQLRFSGEYTMPPIPASSVALRGDVSFAEQVHTREVNASILGASAAGRVMRSLRGALSWTTAQSRAWYTCDGLDSASWGQRVRGLVASPSGRRFGGLVLSGMVLLTLFWALVLREAPTSALVTLPAKGGPSVVGMGDGKRPVKPAGISPATEKRLMKVRLFLAKKACREAAIDLRNLVREQPKLAGAHYLLGASEVCRRRYLEGLLAYEQAVKLDGRYREDARVREDVQRMLRRRKTRAQAFTFVEKVLGKAGGVPLLVELASKEKKRKLRHRARKLLKGWGASRKVDWVSSLSLDLQQLSSCKAREEVVRKLHILGDPKALPVLRRARGARGGFLNIRRKNRCIRKAIDNAIAALEKR